MSNNNKQPSKELDKLLVELKTTIAKLKELYKTIDKKALEEGFSLDEIYDIANSIDVSTTKTIIKKIIEEETNNTNTNNSNKNNFPLYFQHFQ